MRKSIFRLFREFLESKRVEESVQKAREEFLKNPTEAILKEMIAQAEPGVELTVTLLSGVKLTVTRTNNGVAVKQGSNLIEGSF